MILKSPFSISSRLLPCLTIGGADIQLDYSSRPTEDGRVRYLWTIDFPDGSSLSGDDLQSGADGGTLLDGFRALISFLSACGESYRYRMRTVGAEACDIDSNEALFPAPIPEWCYMHSNEIECFAFELEEAEEDLLTEE